MTARHPRRLRPKALLRCTTAALRCTTALLRCTTAVLRRTRAVLPWVVGMLLCTIGPVSGTARAEPLRNRQQWGVPSPEPAFLELGADLDGRPEAWASATGWFRTRAEGLWNLDLDRGLDPSGQPLFPVPPSDPRAQLLTHADLRLRADLALHAPKGGAGVYVRLDALDNLALGSLPDGPPSATVGQRTPQTPLVVRRAYGVIALPFGVLAAGRMNAHWGLGLVAHGGDCADCDHGNASDRLALVTPLAGHVWAAAWDFSATGPQAVRPAGARVVDLDPSDDVRSWTLAVLRYHNDLTRLRRRNAGKSTLDYGAYVSHRQQEVDVPAAWLGTAGGALEAKQWVPRDLRAWAGDLWLRLTGPWGRIEAEGTVISGKYGQSSLIPGVQWRAEVEALQAGAALQSDFLLTGPKGERHEGLSGGLDGGVASGDPAPGFGVFASPTSTGAQPGSLRGSQVVPPGDLRADELHFHPDFRIDRLLFREILGAVADAAYVRPHLAWTTAIGAGRLKAEVAAVASWALHAQSTPGGKRALGLEIDPSLDYSTEDGVDLSLHHALLLPGAGLDNPVAGLQARTAQMVRFLVRVRY